MTQAEFLTRLARKVKRTKARFVPKDWSRSAIRESKTDTCPIEFLAGSNRGTVISASKRLRLSTRTLNNIINAADYNVSIPLRKKLLKAVGL